MANTGIGIYRTRGRRGHPIPNRAWMRPDRYRQEGLHPEFDRLPWFELDDADRIFRAPAVQREAVGRHRSPMMVGLTATLVVIALGAVVRWWA